MKKDLESSPKLSSEHSIEETKKEQETVHNQSEVAIKNDSFDASKQSTNQKYFRCSLFTICLLYTSPSPRDRTRSRMPSSA